MLGIDPLLEERGRRACKRARKRLEHLSSVHGALCSIPSTPDNNELTEREVQDLSGQTNAVL